MDAPADRLLAEITRETDQPVSSDAQAISDAIRARHGDAVLATLFYGSCLRPPTGDDVGPGGRDERLHDFYAVVRGVRAATGSRLAALGCRLLPPNVYYIEAQTPAGPVRAKYAMLTPNQFKMGCWIGTFQNYFWGRFAQPTAIVHAVDDAMRKRLRFHLAEAAVTLLFKTAPLLPADATSAQLWTRAFAESYRCELRPEAPQRAEQIYRANAARYDLITPRALAQTTSLGRAPLWLARLRWFLRRLVGKTLNVLRLAKAAFTFAGGIDYIVWKIERHSGIRPQLTPWQRRHPLLAGPVLAVRYWRKGAFR